MARPAAVLSLVLMLAAGGPPAAGAQDEPSAADQLDAAFETLRGDDERAAKRAERRILRLWLDSDSDTVDLLMSWALRAMDADDLPLALDYLDRVVLMKPDYVEGWNKRATVYFMMDDYGSAIADIEQVLALEPRHFGALSGLGIMMSELGERDRAMTVFEAALAIDPLLDNVREALEKLETEEEGLGL